jgi:hypothetical protein
VFDAEVLLDGCDALMRVIDLSCETGAACALFLQPLDRTLNRGYIGGTVPQATVSRTELSIYMLELLHHFRLEIGDVRFRCKIARNFGSDSILMKFACGMAQSSERNQHHAHQFSHFLSRSVRIDCRKRHTGRRYYPCNGSGRYPGGDVSSMRLAFAACS